MPSKRKLMLRSSAHASKEQKRSAAYTDKDRSDPSKSRYRRRKLRRSQANHRPASKGLPPWWTGWLDTHFQTLAFWAAHPNRPNPASGAVAKPRYANIVSTRVAA